MRFKVKKNVTKYVGATSVQSLRFYKVDKLWIEESSLNSLKFSELIIHILEYHLFQKTRTYLVCTSWKCKPLTLRRRLLLGESFEWHYPTRNLFWLESVEHRNPSILYFRFYKVTYIKQRSEIFPAYLHRVSIELIRSIRCDHQSVKRNIGKSRYLAKWAQKELWDEYFKNKKVYWLGRACVYSCGSVSNKLMNLINLFQGTKSYVCRCSVLSGVIGAVHPEPTSGQVLGLRRRSW